jgi:hypothetical protein
MSIGRIRLARGIAICADLIQIGFPVLFGEGLLSPFQDVLDVVVCGVLTMLVGWHYAFIPTFFIELVPFADLAPTWTIAVFIATRRAPIDVKAEVVKSAEIERA